jgi:hypothetical protein
MEGYLRFLYEDSKYIVYLDKDYTMIKYDNIRERSINVRLIVFDKIRNEERPLFINVVYNKYNQVYKINYDYITQLSVDFISMKNHLNNNNEFRNILLTVI